MSRNYSGGWAWAQFTDRCFHDADVSRASQSGGGMCSDVMRLAALDLGKAQEMRRRVGDETSGVGNRDFLA
jgi:hypothetical protein